MGDGGGHAGTIFRTIHAPDVINHIYIICLVQGLMQGSSQLPGTSALAALNDLGAPTEVVEADPENEAEGSGRPYRTN